MRVNLSERAIQRVREKDGVVAIDFIPPVG